MTNHAEDSSVLRRLRATQASQPHHAGPPAEETAPAAGLVCVSHREPYAEVKIGKARQLQRTTGGLVTALDAALRELGGRWIASGERTTAIEAPPDSAGRSYRIEQIGLSQREMDHYYSGFSNRALWPVCHYFIGHLRFRPDEWHDYVRVNRHFADGVVQAVAASPETIAWIHDYQMMLVPRLVRDRVPDATLGFFFHIPFPAAEVFRVLPPRRELLDGMLGADLIGFHTASYQQAFLECARQLLGARIDKNGGVEHRGHHTRTISSPIGIDLAFQTQLASDPRTVARAQRLRKSIPGDSIVLGVDRMDYSKGILERFAGFERLLDRHPEHRGRTTLVQIAVPSRTRVEDYRQLKSAIDETVGRINGKYGDSTWEPVRYLSRGLQAPELTAYYRAADVALITPLRDGLNLVAKEYVASRVDMGGALVLSEFAGAAEELPQAYLVNPFGPDNIAEALHAALTDDRVERERRMTSLSARVQANDVRRWAHSFVQQLKRTRQQ